MDLRLIRHQFPSLQKDWIFFENAGGTQVPDHVIQRVSDFYREYNVQPDYEFAKSIACGQIIQEAHRFIAAWIGAGSEDQIAFGPSATALNRIAAVALMERWHPGDEIIVTVSDHEANVNPWVFLQKSGLNIKFWPINPESYELELETLRQLLSNRTVLVAFPHVSNVLGFENPVAAITDLAHEAGAWVYVDGVASTPHRPVNVQRWDVDFFVFSTYKTFGPHMAALYVKEEIFRELESPNHYFLGNEIPGKFELGTPNLEGLAAILGVRDYFRHVFANNSSVSDRELLQQAMTAIQEYENSLAWQLIAGLQHLPGVRIVGPSDPSQRKGRVPVVAFTVENIEPDQIARQLGEHNIVVKSGHFYAYRLVEFLGLLPRGGVIRASLVHYNTSTEIDKFLDLMEQVIR